MKSKRIKMGNKYCKKCGRECKNQMQEDEELCEHHLRNKLIGEVNEAISGIN